MKSLIKVKNLLKKYDGRTVVNEVSFDIFENEVLGIIGPNGAGKTTIIEMILGIRICNSGDIYYWKDNFKSEIGAQLQSVPFYPDMNVLDNLKLFSVFYGKENSDKELIDLLNQFGLSDVIYSKANRVSGGQQKRLAIAITILNDPQVIFLDEPTAALDPRARHNIRNLILELKEKEISVVFSSHNIEEVERLADRIIIINNGIIEDKGTPQDLLAKYEVENLEKLYLKTT